MKFTVTRALTCVVGLALLAGTVAGQVVTGAPAFGSFGGGPFDTVNLGNLNVHFGVPIVHKPGRGIPFNYDLDYESSIWTPIGLIGLQTWQPTFNWGWTASWGGGNTGYIKFATTYSTCYILVGGVEEPYYDGIYTYTGFVYVDPWGTSHPFTASYSYNSCTGSATSLYFPATATDGSGLVLTSWSGPIATPGHATLNPPLNPAGSGQATTVTDANGNQITSNTGGTFTDTLNTTTALVITGAQPSPVNFKYNGPSGQVSVVVSYVSYTVKTHFGCSGVSEYGPTATSLVDKITLADGSFYQFYYEATIGFSGDVTGRISSVTLPTGGTIAYSYPPTNSGADNGITCADGSANGLTRTLSPVGPWTYARNLISGNHWKTTVTTPPDPANSGSANDVTVIDFAKDSATTNPTLNFYETQRVTNQGSSTAIATTMTCYNAPTGTTPTPATCSTTPVSTPILRVTSFNYLPNASGMEAETDSTYDVFGLIHNASNYDFTATPPGSLLRLTATTYYGGMSNGIVDRPYQVQIYNGSSALQAQTTYIYDEGTPTPTSVPQHTSIIGSRGNLTTIEAQANAVGTTLYRHFTYYDTGMLNTSTGASTSSTTNGPTTTYNYASGAASCNDSFVTSISEPLSLTRSMQWSCVGGALTQRMDENSQPTGYSYDNMWRMNGVTYPDGGATTPLYSISASNPNIQITSKITASTSLISDTVLDGLGRPVHQELTSDPNGTSSVDTTYDALGRVASVSNPHHTGGSPTDGTTSYLYDALGRTTTITRPDSSTVSITYTQRATEIQDEGNGTSRVTKVNQANGLGQLVSTCEMTSVTQMGPSGNVPAACSQDIPVTGFVTSYTYDALGNILSVNQGAGLNPRTYAYDMLSRMTSEIDPELNGNAITYAYDSCTFGAGELCTRTAPKPNQTGSATVITTYSYDSLHRLTSKSYNDGSTPTADYYYDQTFASYPKGRLTSMGTYVGSGFTTSRIFGYDPMGRIVNDSQCTPLNCPASTFLSVTYTYDLLGDIAMAYNQTEGVTYTNSYDAADRLTKLQSSFSDTYHPGTLFTIPSNQYNPLGEVKQATLGNGIVRNLSYDNRGRLTGQTDGSTYNFTLSYTPDSNVLTGNDSLTGNWTYGYDDFSRLSTSTKTGQNFNYKYDRFGNRWQQNAPLGGPAPQYTFGANNQIQGAPPSCTSSNHYCYDAAGNLLNDSFHGYTYDAEGRVTAVDGGSTASYVYDASGRVVRRSIGATTLDFVLDLNGKGVTELAGGTWDRSELYAAGTHVATYADGITYFFHPDWLGSVRAETKYDGTLAGSMTNYAFGDGQVWTGRLPSWQNFAQGDIDDGSGLDLFMFRQYSNVQGRWIMPDPAGMAAVDPTNPQTWNRYAYVANNPLSGTDPLGLQEGDCDPLDPDCFNPCDFDPIFCFPPPDGGGGGGAGTPSPEPPPTPDELPRQGGKWLNNETLGLPTGMNLKPMSLAELLGLSPGCEFGVCAPLEPNSYTAGVGTLGKVAIGTVEVIDALAALTFEVLLMQQSDAAPPRGQEWCTYSGEFQDRSMDHKFKICSYSCPSGHGQTLVWPVGQACPSTTQFRIP